MPIYLINEPCNLLGYLTLECALAAEGLQTIECDDDWWVYGCGIWDPGEDYNILLKRARVGKLLGVVGLTVEEDTLTAYTPEDRERLGHLLQHAGTIYTNDKLSAEWMQHYACAATAQGHPAWLAKNVIGYTKNCVSEGDNIGEWLAHGWSGRAVARDKPDFYIANGDLGPAIAAALVGAACILYIPPHAAGGRHDMLDKHPLTRFAHEFNVAACLASSEEELSQALAKASAGELPVVSPSRVDIERMRARTTINNLLAVRETVSTITVSDTIASCLGVAVKTAVVPAVGDGPRELVLGTVFDPEKHYDDFYFAEGKGLLYTRPDGSRDIYKGPARRWQGFVKVASILSSIIPKRQGRKYLSLGCGYGDDVATFRADGWEAYGIDLSEAAVSNAAPEVKDCVLLGNVLDPAVLADVGENFTVIVSFDFWEHIWEGETAALMARVYELLAPGGIHFNIICTRGAAEQDHVYKPGIKFTKDNSWLLASGHVNVRRWSYWIQEFTRFGFRPDFATAYLFQVARAEDAGLRQAASWSTRHTVVVKKPRKA